MDWPTEQEQIDFTIWQAIKTLKEYKPEFLTEQAKRWQEAS